MDALREWSSFASANKIIRPGTQLKLDQRLGELKGLARFRVTVERVKNTARMILRDDNGRGAEKQGRGSAGGREADMGGNVADYLGLPFVSIPCVPAIDSGRPHPAFLLRLDREIGLAQPPAQGARVSYSRPWPHQSSIW